MPYSSLTDRAMPYHTDGSVVKIISAANGVVYSFNASEMLELNDEDKTPVGPSLTGYYYVTVFFPEPRVVTGLFGGVEDQYGPSLVEGSSDSTNGLDGTWETASAPNGYNSWPGDFDNWRKNIKPVSFTQAVRVIRVKFAFFTHVIVLHVYGHKATGETPDDISFLDAEAADAEFTTPLDFGDRPAGTSVQRQIKIKNASTTKTANNVNLYVEDPADIVRIAWSNAGPWQTTLNIASLAAGAKSNVIYVKCETPAPPTPLGPRRAPIRVSVGSWA
jgi:hypothetical protein